MIIILVGCIYFETPCTSTVEIETIQNLHLSEILRKVDQWPCMDEIRLYIKQINSGKAPGLDGIPVKQLKTGSENMHWPIHNFFTEWWSGADIFQYWCDARLVLLYKKNGKKTISNHYYDNTWPEVVDTFRPLLIRKYLPNFPTISNQKIFAKLSNHFWLEDIFQTFQSFLTRRCLLNFPTTSD